MAYCDEYLELISAAIDGALSPAEKEKLNVHLAQCPGCRALYEELTALHTTLEELPPVEVPADLRDRIMNAVAAEQVLPFAPARPKKAAPWRRWMATAAVLALAVLGTWSWRPWERTAPTGAAPAAQEPAQAENATLQDSLPQTSATPRAGDAKPETASYPDGEVPNADSTRAKVWTDPSTDGALPEPVDPEFCEEAPNSIAPQMAPMTPKTTQPASEAGAGADGESGTQSLSQAPVLFSVPTADLTQAPPPPESPQETLPPMVRSFLMPANTSLTPQEPQPLTTWEALELVADYCFGNSGYETLREDLEGEVPSARFTLLDGAEPFTGGVITSTGEDESFFFFTCSWNDEPENPYHYSVHKQERYVVWQGEAPIDGEFQP